MRDINITIVNWKARDDIIQCLSTLFYDLEHSGLDAVVHVVDNSNNCDGIKEYLEKNFPQVKYINTKGNLGFGSAQNIGLKAESARFYLPLNPDIKFISNKPILKELMDWLKKNPAAGIVGPKLLNEDSSIQESCCRFYNFFDPIIRRFELDKKYSWAKRRVDNYLMRDFDHQKTVPVDWIMGSFMLVKNEAVEDIGFFDDRFFMYFEDCDWCRTAWRRGWQVYYYADAHAVHAHRRDSANDFSAWKAVLSNPVARMHIKSWFQYFWKWRFKREHYGI